MNKSLDANKIFYAVASAEKGKKMMMLSCKNKFCLNPIKQWSSLEIHFETGFQTNVISVLAFNRL